jgi:hypothetical protein
MCGVATALLEILYIQLFENNDQMNIFVTVLIWPVYLIGIPFRALKKRQRERLERLERAQQINRAYHNTIRIIQSEPQNAKFYTTAGTKIHKDIEQELNFTPPTSRLNDVEA